jgi:hypothetical protein
MGDVNEVVYRDDGRYRDSIREHVVRGVEDIEAREVDARWHPEHLVDRIGASRVPQPLNPRRVGSRTAPLIAIQHGDSNAADLK